MIDTLITASLWAGLAYLCVGFVAYAIQRSSNAVPISQATEPETIAPQAITDPVAEALEQIEAAYKGVDTVVPFKRPTPQYSDLALIRFAKSLAKQGRYSKAALKWSYDRKLSQSVRNGLLQLTRASA